MIKSQVVKDRTAASDNIDDKLINPAIKSAQDTYIQSVLGSDLYNRLLDGIAANTLTINEKKLIDTYIVDALVWYTLSELPIMLGYKFFNKNVLKGQSEGEQTPTMSEMIELEERYKNKAESYIERLVNYLRQSEVDNLYPLYSNYGTGKDVIKPSRTSYQTSIYLGGSEGDCGDLRPFRDYYQGDGPI